MNYKDFKIDYDEPFGRIETLYSQIGIYKFVDQLKEQYGVPENAPLPYKILSFNEKTKEKLKDQLFYNWKNYNYDRYSGISKTKKIKKYVKEHDLSYSDEQRLAWHYYFGCTPVVDNDIPDDIIRVQAEWDDKLIKEIVDRFNKDQKILVNFN